MDQQYQMPANVSGTRTFRNQKGILTQVRTRDHSKYDLALNDREWLCELRKKAQQLERPTSEAQQHKIIMTMFMALLNNDLELSICSFAATVHELFTDDIEVITSAVREFLVMLGFAILIESTDIFGSLTT